MPTADPFPVRWTVANTLALLFGYVLYTPIAHGLTGPHPGGLNAAQIVAHSVALSVVAASGAWSQRQVLGPYVPVHWRRIPMAVIGFVAAFWAGSYQPWLTGPDFDIVFGSFVLGNAVWLGVVPARGHGVAATVVFLSFPVACFLWQFVVLGVVLYLGETPDLQASTSLHSAYWISVGVSMGLLGGLIGGPALRRMLTSRPS